MNRSFAEITRRQQFFLELIILILVILGSYSPYPFSIVPGCILTFLPGYFLIISIQSFRITKTRMWIINLIRLVASSFVISLIILPITAFVFLFIIGFIDLLLFTIMITNISYVVSVYIREKHPLQNKKNIVELGSNLTRYSAILTIVFALVIGIVVFIFNVLYTNFSLSEGTFLIRDITMYLSRIQALKRGTWSIPDLLNENAPLTNPFITSLSFMFFAIFFSNTKIDYSISLALGAANALLLIMVLLTSFMVFIKIRKRINPLALIPLYLLALGPDFTGILFLLGIYTDSVYRGIKIPTGTIQNGHIVHYYTMGFPENAYITGFHHIPGMIIFLFVLSFLFTQRLNDLNYKIIIPLVLMLFVSIFYHIAITLMVSGAALLAFFFYFTWKFFLQTRSFVRVRLQKIIMFTWISMIGVVLLLFPLSWTILHSQVVLNIRIFTLDVVLAFGLYLGFILLLGIIGAIFLFKSIESIGGYVLLSVFIFQLVFNILYTPYRPRADGTLLYAGYFTLIPLQFTAMILVFFVFDYLTRTKNSETKSNPYNLSDLEARTNNNKKPKIRSSVFKISTIVMIGFLLVQPWTNTLHMFSSNYGEFHLNFYGSVPIITPNEAPAYAWIRDYTPSDAIILIDPENWEITAITGRAVIYSAYRFNSSDPRNIDIVTIYCTNDVSLASSLLRQYSVSYIVITPYEQEKYNGTQKFFNNPSLFEMVYDYSNVLIYKFS